MDKLKNQEQLASYLNGLQFGGQLNKFSYRKGNLLYESGNCHLLVSGNDAYDFEVIDDYDDFRVAIKFKEKNIAHQCSCESPVICAHVYASLQQAQQEMNRSFLPQNKEGLKYSREGMVKRVLEEREERAQKEHFELEFANNIYGEHLLKNQQGKTYQLSFYDFNKKLGYCSCPDYQTNKLETCKHLMFAFTAFFKEHELKDLPKQTYPFLEIFRHPLKDYQIAWFYPHEPGPEIKELLDLYFDDDRVFKSKKMNEIDQFLEQIQSFKLVKVRPEVESYISQYFEAKTLKDSFQQAVVSDKLLKEPLFPYQKQGVLFISERRASILADEIGLGKSAQALGAAIMKMKYSKLENVQILCPEPLINHWQTEIEKWVPQSLSSSFQLSFFDQINTIDKCDFLIIDEAQKIDDYESGLLAQINRMSFRHILLITDSKLESSLIKFYAMSALVDPYLLTPLWELSYKHCLFDAQNSQKIVGYHSLDLVVNKMKAVYLRRQRLEVIDQLPKVRLVEIPIALPENLKNEQSKYSSRISKWCAKNKWSKYEELQLKKDLMSLHQLGIFAKGSESGAEMTPKLTELKHFILHKLHLEADEKAIIFVDSKTIQNQIKRILIEENKNVSLFKQGHKNIEDAQFYIGEESGQEKLPMAQHFIYYHLPFQQELMGKRMSQVLEDQQGLNQSRFYLLLNTESFEAILNDWRVSKPHYLKQLMSFMSSKADHQELGLRLKEDFIHELKRLISHQPIDQNSQYQMSLFQEETKTSDIEKKALKPKGEEPLASFFNQWMKTISEFEKLSKEEQDFIKSANMTIQKSAKEINFKFKKN
mgnify:CR=1 FL=1